MAHWPFEGRQAEMALLQSWYAESDVDAALIAAPAGVGKTRLAREVLPALGAAQTAWITGTRAAAAIPFAAVAPLLPEGVAAGTSVEMVRAAGERMADWGGRRGVALVVDDAHLLDDASATLVAHLVHQGLAFVLMTARSGEAISDGLMQIVKDGRGQRVELARLPDEVIDQLIDHAAVATVDTHARRRLYRIAEGDPLALRELLHGAQPGGLTELVTSRVDGLDPGVRYAVELVACGEPLPVPMLRELVGAYAVVRAEDTGLIVVERAGQRQVARLDHPLYGEVLRSGTSVSRLTRTYAALAGALLRTPLRRRGDILRAAVWQVEAGEIGRPDVVRSGAREAIGHADLRLAERLARAARQAEPGGTADRLLAEVLAYRGQVAEAGELLATSSPPTADDHLAWTVTRAETIYWGDGDTDAALSTLDTLGEHPVARASRSWLLFFDGRCQDAARTVDGVLAEAGVDPKAVIWACAAGTAAHGFLGEGCAAEKVHAHGARIAAAHADVLPWGEVEVDTGMCLAHLASGHPNAAYDIAVAGYHKALDGGATMMVAGWALHAGLAALARGHLDEAARLLAEAQAGFDVNDTFRLGRCCLAARAGAAALAGDRAAYQLMARADKLAHPCNKVLAPWIDGWRAWTAYAAGDLGSAVVAAKRAADAAREAAMPAVETLARYDLARLGAPVDLVRLSGIDHEIAGTACRAARALANRDCTADLETAARAFHANGYDLLAAELYGAAGHRYHRLHRWAESDLAKAHAVKLRAAFPNARSPLLRPDDLTTLLTFRERQVLMLAVEHTSAEIAGRLRLAVATVNNNLARAYHKLGINGRSQLRDLLDGERNG